MERGMAKAKLNDNISGIYPMLYAFYDDQERLDRDAMRLQVEKVVGAGVSGLAVGGLATECNKLSTAERRQMLEWVIEDNAGRLPISVTIAESSVAGQQEMARYAAELGASWVVLQPPPVKGASEAELIRFYGAVADAAALPVGIQNAPEYIGIGMSNQGFATLRRNHANVSILKAEGPATYIDQLMRDTDGDYHIFNGRNGMELVDSLRAGCVGMIPGVETCDIQSKIFAAFAAGDLAAADRQWLELVPLLTFLMHSIDHLLCYGKRLSAARLGMADVFDRGPAQKPTEFGTDLVQRWAACLPKTL
jgi:4-hydroxy-tetrahydrodipicolinate synthase